VSDDISAASPRMGGSQRTSIEDIKLRVRQLSIESRNAASRREQSRSAIKLPSSSLPTYPSPSSSNQLNESGTTKGKIHLRSESTSSAHATTSSDSYGDHLILPNAAIDLLQPVDEAASTNHHDKGESIDTNVSSSTGVIDSMSELAVIDLNATEATSDNNYMASEESLVVSAEESIVVSPAGSVVESADGPLMDTAKEEDMDAESFDVPATELLPTTAESPVVISPAPADNESNNSPVILINKSSALDRQQDQSNDTASSRVFKLFDASTTPLPLVATATGSIRTSISKESPIRPSVIRSIPLDIFKSEKSPAADLFSKTNDATSDLFSSPAVETQTLTGIILPTFACI
jgi:hypothetical protein